MTNPPTLFAGSRVGQLRLLMRVADATKGSYNTRKRWRVVCDCGKRLTVPEAYLLRDKPKTHCGDRIHTQTFQSANKEEHGIYTMMHVRCENPDHVGYPHYGARNVKVCEEWHRESNPDGEGFKKFMAVVGKRPSKKHSIDRKDPDVWYCPHNVAWATWVHQNTNKRIHKHDSKELADRCEKCPHKVGVLKEVTT